MKSCSTREAGSVVKPALPETNSSLVLGIRNVNWKLAPVSVARLFYGWLNLNRVGRARALPGLEL